MIAAVALAAALAVAPPPADSAARLLAEGRFEDAERTALAALAVAGRAPGPDSLRLAAALEQLAAVRLRLARTGPEELARARRALAIRERAFGPADARVAPALALLGEIHLAADRLADSRTVAERALRLLDPEPGGHDAERARTLALLARLDSAAGDLAGAIARSTEVLALRERLEGPEGAGTAQALQDLAIAYRDAGRSVEALRTYRRALELRERLLGPAHPDLAATLVNLANLYYDLGDFASSIALNRRALAIRESALGPDHPAVGTSLMILANALERHGDPAAAVPLHERALAIFERAYGAWHRAVARSLNNLALAHVSLGRLEVARPLYRRSIAIRDSVLGPGSEEAARPRLRLGLLHLAADEPAAAERVLREASEAIHGAFGRDHPAAADADIALACALLRLGRDGEALEHALAAEHATLEHLRATAQGLDETQALLYTAFRSSGLQVGITLAAAHPDDSSLVARVWEGLARSRSVVLDEMAARRRWASDTRDAGVARLHTRVAEARDRLARLAIEGGGTDSASAARLAAAIAAKRQAEQALADRSVAFRRQRSGADAGFGEIRAALPAGAALVSYAWSELLPRRGETDTTLGLVAFVLPPGGAPRAVKLGEAAAIEAETRAWLAAIRRAPDALRRARDERACEALGRTLRARLWDPLAPLVAGASRVFVVPELGLHAVPFAALPDGRGRVLAESGPLLEMLAIERDLAGPAAAGREGRGLLAIGGPDFDAAPGPGAGGPFALRASADPCAPLAGGGFEPLPGAAAEAGEIAAFWDASLASGPPAGEAGALVLRGAAATERALRTLASGRRALHVAAHGFFLPERCPAAGAEAGPAPDRHALLRAGLALAGANRRGPSVPPDDDGILTAEEIASLDLEGLEWVVLSACETGLGEVDVNEGVFGLRRAFRAAGAGAIVMSLWRVGDADTRAWMRALYEARFGRGLDGAAAARAATRAVLAGRRRSGTGTHPYHWAGFVIEGGSASGAGEGRRQRPR